MTGLKKLIGAAALMVSAFIWGSSAQATTLTFDLQSGGFNYSWIMDSDPTTVAFTVPGFFTGTTQFTGQAMGTSLALPAGTLFFYAGTIGGGLAFDDDGPGGLVTFFGDMLYSNTEAAPHFQAGIYNVAPGTLTIANLATTPIPAALPLFVSALAGLGFFGWKRRGRQQQVA